MYIYIFNLYFPKQSIYFFLRFFIFFEVISRYFMFLMLLFLYPVASYFHNAFSDYCLYIWGSYSFLFTASHLI